MGPEGTQVDPTQATPIGRIPTEDSSAPVLPTLNPADSPYTPLSLPTVEPRQIPVPEAAPEPQNLGAVSHGGAIAYMADKILRGAMQGYDAAQQHKADQFNKKLKAQEDIYNQQDQQFKALSKAGYGPVLKDASQIMSPDFVKSPEFQAASPEWKAAYNRLFAANQAIMQTIGSRIPQPKQSKKSKQGQANGTDQTSLLQRFLNHGNDPQDALQAVYTAKMNMPPTGFIEMMPYFNAQYQQQQRQKAAGEAATTQAASQKAQNEARLQQLLSQAPPSEPDAARAREEEISRLQQAIEPPRRTFTTAETTRYKKDASGNEVQYQVDPYTGEEVPGTEKTVKTAAAVAPKGWKVTGQIATNQDTGQQFALDDPNAPDFVKSINEAIKQSKEVSTVGTHMVPVWRGNQEFLVPVETTSTKHVGGAGGGAGATETPKTTPSATGAASTPHKKGAISHQSGVLGEGTPVGWKPSAEYNELSKKAGDAAVAYTNLSSQALEAARQVKTLTANPANGSASMGLTANYLRNVIGAHPAGGGGASVRITNAEWQMAQQSRPAWAGAMAHFVKNGNDGYTYISGVVLTPQQATQMRDEVVGAAAAARRTRDQLQKQADAQQEKDRGSVGGPTSQWEPPAGAPDPAKLADGTTLHAKGSDVVTAVVRGGKWTQP